MNPSYIIDPTFIVVPAIFLGLPWIILHYVTKWKTAATITSDDEALLEELYNLAKRLDERMDTVERLVASDNPGFTAARLHADREIDNVPLRELEELMALKKEIRK
jgi:phage shock protein B